ncbi:hypothetical protein PMPD1_0063 [Paramixta manurensis]|uniref:Uncharacterized protein n=1 Tax=Paramixta manurensis TaxID=2740817 RepID=A0A6M8U8D8_9GAMM|nr:hypothetical protein PMPD1_0063 [Erwiniaceae bacterium PD-1]
MAAGGSFTFGSMSGSGYINASHDKMDSNYDSVQEQTGIYAGKGGFDITVGNHTQLDGAVIASTATADKNSLDTGTLGFSDIHNQADYEVEHQGVAVNGGGGSVGGQFKGNMTGGVLALSKHKGHAEGTTEAAVSEGNITLRDPAHQQQSVADLSRDAENANDSISPIFDKEKEQNRLQEAQLIGEIGGQAADIARTQGDLNALAEAKKDHPGLSADALRKTDEYQAEMAQYGTGSTLQRAIQASTAAIQGLAGGDLRGALAGASAPELAHLLKPTEGNPAVNAMAHAILGGAVAMLQGNNGLAGAAGAASSELAARAITAVLYAGRDASSLTEDEKQTVSMLATLSAGIAGGVAGGNSSDALAGAQSGKNAVENNYLSSTEKSRQTELNHKQNLTPQEQQERDALNRKDAETSKTLVDACMGGSASACTAARKDAQEKQDTYQSLSYQNQKEAQAGYQQIQQLLNGTSSEAKQTQELFNGMVSAYMRTGMSEEAAKSAVGYQLSAMYIAGGIAGIGSGKTVDEGLIPGVKPSTPSTKPGTGSQTENKPSSGAENVATL